MLHLKLIRRFPIDCKKFKRFLWISSHSNTDVGLSDDGKQEKNHRLFGTDLPYGIRDSKDAKYMAEELGIAERRLMFEALRKKMTDQYMEQKRLGKAEIHHDDLLRIWYVSLIPSFVLGLLDSALMIFASESINSSFAAVYGMSIMSAAALGNIATSIVLLQTQVHFGHLIERFGLRYPMLSVEQMNNRDVEKVTYWARFLGILTGSICGLFPLFFYDNLTAEEIQRKARASAYMLRENHEAAVDMIDDPSEPPPTEHMIIQYEENEAMRKELFRRYAVDEGEPIELELIIPD